MRTTNAVTSAGVAVSDEKRRRRARKAAPDDEAAQSVEQAEAARRGEPAPPMRLRAGDHTAVSAIAAEDKLELPEALHQVIALGIRARREGWEASALSLAIWSDLRERSLAELRLTEGEASLVCDVLNGRGNLLKFGMGEGESSSPGVLYAELADGVSLSRLDEKWGVDAKPFLRRARDWTPAQVAAINEAAARFWEHTERDTGEMLREVGLVRDPA